MNEPDPRPRQEEAIAAVSSIGNLKSEICNGPWFFSDPAAVTLVRNTADSWDRTPFAQGSKAKGPTGGIDCVGFVEEVMRETGVAPAFNFPRSDADYKGHAHNDKIVDYLRGQKTDDPQSAQLARIFAKLENIEELVPKAEWPNRLVINTGLMPGDLLVIQPRIGIWHLPIMMTDRMFKHCAFPGGVTEGDITQEDYRSRIVAIFRARSQSEICNLKSEISP